MITKSHYGRLLGGVIAPIAIMLPSLCGAAFNFTATPIIFDPDGKAGGIGDKTVVVFDWFVDSGLITDVPGPTPLFPPDTTKSVQALGHGTLATLGDSDGPLPALPGLNTEFQITYAAAFGEQGTSNSAGDRVDFVEDPDQSFSNVFTIYYDDLTAGGTRASAFTGLGYTDGLPILEGQIVSMPVGNFVRTSDNLPPFDSSGANNYPGITTIEGGGAQTVIVQVTSFNEDFFKNLTVGSLINFTNENKLAFIQNNPSMNFEVPSGTTVTANVGDTNGYTGPDMEFQLDHSNTYNIIPTALSCRMTGGGNDTAGIYTNPLTGEKLGWDGTEVSGSHSVTETIVTVKGKSGKVTTEDVTLTNVYTFGGQAGANTNGANDGQPKGEREHVNHSGPAGQWSFHMGTASAPPGTEINKIVCSDEGWCRQARPAPTKQIDFDGIGSFRNIIDIGDLNASGTCASVAETTGKPSERARGTYNWAEFHIEDRGEPGKEGQHTTADPALCPANGTGTDAFDNFFGPPVFNDFTCLADGGPDCPDFYRIRIYCGVEPEFDSNGDLSNFAAIEAKKYTKPIYEVFGYIDGGNFQIHPPTGFDLK